MRYLSTRGQVKDIPFKQAVMMGLAEDGGLLLPEEIPRLTQEDLAEIAELPFPELALRIMSLFIDDIPATDLKDLVDRSYATFDHPEVTPVVKQGDLFILELFHGPTLAFKDVALQFLGNLFEYLLTESGERMNIIGATSGDTGSAAIYGVRGKSNINIFILHPYKRASKVQELQMTTVPEENVYNLAIRGTFDNCQDIVKGAFNDLEFKKKHALGAVNSINWARVVAQIAYYFYAWGQVRKATGQDKIFFSVPTGNFGDIFAGYIAKRMGLPIEKLILATNNNCILTRFVANGDYSIGEVHKTVSPSMDIQVASNFERYLYYLYDGDQDRVRTAFEDFARTGAMEFPAELQDKVHEEFLSMTVSDKRTIETIRKFYDETGYILDPHTAVGVLAAESLVTDDIPVVCLATAHPAKFPDAIYEAIGQVPHRPECLVGIESRKRRCKIIDDDLELVKAYVASHAL